MTRPDYLDIAENSRDALALFEAMLRRDVHGVNAILANCNATALVEHLAAIGANALVAAGLDPLEWVTVTRAGLADLGDDAINRMGEQ